MKETLIASYERKSTLWKNANGFYHAQDWTRMECVICDFTDEINSYKEENIKWIDKDGNDVTEQQIERLYGKPYLIRLINNRRTNTKCFWFKTKEEANEFFFKIMNDRILKGWCKA